ncbi:hypothetical protein [Roseisolibacter agri]|uniref:Uncharacterized protein n=1 Tax=Roseisolibacter agri TaxID=2014610 RepID=A0AA37QCH9_9BACT|nr:hypothetical protein [Roseisolibacter agri]GLC27767.1 hypothetical protein rosag_42800 [Roseisolibacter agri]
MSDTLDLGDYFLRFPEALQDKYGTTFGVGFQDIKERFAPVGLGSRSITVDDVLAIFDVSLPFVQDWTKPDREELDRKMNDRERPVAALIRDLRSVEYRREIIVALVNAFRELSLTALVLHHVYPDRFAMCSHHLASQLYVTGPTVPTFYIDYCTELREWARRRWATPGIRTVVDAEFALWTWYRLAYSRKHADPVHHGRFHRDEWVQERRALRIAKALNTTDRLDLARSYLETDATVAALIAWRELEVVARTVSGPGVLREDNCRALLRKLPPERFPRGTDGYTLANLWDRRNQVTHHGAEVSRVDAKRIVDGVTAFVEHNSEVASAGLRSIP